MNILVLEDSPERIKVFKEHLDGDITFVNDSFSAIKLLKDNTYDIIFLDYDLGDKTKGSGAICAHFLAAKEIASRTIIHSMNLVGVSRMKMILPNAEVIPFHELFK
jgi:CheY-like chemotaxis protein